MNSQMMESVSVLKDLLGKIPMIEDIEIMNLTERGFTVFIKDREHKAVENHVICLKRAVPLSVKEAIKQSDNQIYQIIMAPYISEISSKICETESDIAICPEIV